MRHGPHICTDRAALSTSVSKRLCNGDLYFPVDSRAQRVHTHTLIDPPAPRWSETHICPPADYAMQKATTRGALLRPLVPRPCALWM